MDFGREGGCVGPLFAPLFTSARVQNRFQAPPVFATGTYYVLVLRMYEYSFFHTWHQVLLLLFLLFIYCSKRGTTYEYEYEYINVVVFDAWCQVGNKEQNKRRKWYSRIRFTCSIPW